MAEKDQKSAEKRSPPGDIQKVANAFTEQPLSDRENALVKRAYELFEVFREKLRPLHDEMREARAFRMLRQNERPITAPPGNTLNSCIDCAVSDQSDNIPTALLMPEREETANTAEQMSDVVGFVLEQAGWEEKYLEAIEDATVTGTGIIQSFWDDDMDEGKGMVNLLRWHPEDFYPDPMYEDLQDGRGVFKATRTTVACVQEHYPDVAEYVKADRTLISEYSDPIAEAPGNDEMTVLLEFWYKHYDAKARKNRVHMALLAGRALLYSSETGFGVKGENEKKVLAREGVYAHGEYPFVMFKYRKVWRAPFGTGMIHDHKDTQATIDRYFKYIDDNARESSLTRHFIRKNSGINPEDVADLSKTVLEWEGNDIREVMQTVQATPLNGQVFQALQYLENAIKENSGQNQFARGEGGLGVTAASAIQSLQEAGGKTSRMHTEFYKEAFKRLVMQILWLLSEYLEPGRKIKIVGDWDNSGNMKDMLVELLIPKAEGDKLPKPAYNVRVQVQKKNPLQLQADNEFVMNSWQMAGQTGLQIDPAAIVELLEGYPKKQAVLKMLREASQQQQMMQQLQAQNEQLTQQLGQQKQANSAYLKALMTSGGNAQTQPATTQTTGATLPEL